MKTIRKNSQLTMLITELKKLAINKERKLWKVIATELQKPTRQRRVINLYKIDKSTRDGETVIVPGKVLSLGSVSKAITVAALSFSQGAREKIVAQGGKAISINQMMKDNPDAKMMRILG